MSLWPVSHSAAEEGSDLHKLVCWNVCKRGGILFTAVGQFKLDSGAPLMATRLTLSLKCRDEFVTLSCFAIHLYTESERLFAV